MEESAVAPAQGVAMPAFARAHLAHAVVQHLAEREGILLLHLKGPALVPGLRTPGRQSGVQGPGSRGSLGLAPCPKLEVLAIRDREAEEAHPRLH